MTAVLLLVLGGALALGAYTYLGYPALLWLATRRRHDPPPDPPAEWPALSISLPVHNEEATIAATIESLLALDYPADRRQIVVVSDASTDRTDTIVAAYADRGVELLRLERRGGKTAAENAARPLLRGDLVLNTDASVRVHPQALKALVAWFGDPAVGVASARDVSVGGKEGKGEGGYVGYEMWVRQLETRFDGIVGASGCCYVARAAVHRRDLPDGLSRDFAAPLLARELGLRAVSVPAALCYVPRVASLRREYDRKVRTIARGLATQWHLRRLLDPRRFGAFAWMLLSHKVCRWMVPWSLVAAAMALAGLAPGYEWARWTAVSAAVGLLLAAVGWRWPEGSAPPRLVAIPAYVAAGTLATMQAWVRAVTVGGGIPVWEPSRRPRANSRLGPGPWPA